MERILLLEDEESVNRGVSFTLDKEGYDVCSCRTVEEALRVFDEFSPQLLICDVTLPDGSGLDVVRYARERSGAYIICLTALDSEIDQVMGYESGADDYVTKPFSPSELMARVDALHRRVVAARSRDEVSYLEEMTSGDFVLNLRSRTLKKRGQLVELTQVEFQIMEYFFANPGKALSRTDILTRVWGEEYFGEEKIVDVNIRRLRMKIEETPSEPQYILTVWGFGYKWSV